MLKPLSHSMARLSAVLLGACLASAASAQSAPATSAAAQTPAKSAADTAANDAYLAKAGTLYYSTAKAGLSGFDCAVHPDWRALFVSANPGTAVASDDPRILLLKSVSIKLHGRMKGGSSLEWTPAPGKVTDDASTGLLDNMQKATEQTLMGFMQFWTPFVDGSAVPANSAGLAVTRNDKQEVTLHADEAGTSVTEVFDSNSVLKDFDVVLNGADIRFGPSYKYTEKGLLVSGFLAHILPAGATAGQSQEMHVGIEYSPVDSFLIPSRVNMEVVGTGIFNFTFDGCTATPTTK